jgi:hypothetical protein
MGIDTRQGTRTTGVTLCDVMTTAHKDDDSMCPVNPRSPPCLTAQPPPTLTTQLH